MHLAVDRAREDLGLADRQFVAFAAHHLDQDGELQFAAAHHFEGVRAQFDSTRIETLVSSSLSSRSRRLREVTNVPSRPANGDVLTVKVIGDGRLVDLDPRQRLGVSALVIGIADGDALHAGDGQDVAGRATVSSTRFSPSNEYSLVMRVFCIEPSSLTDARPHRRDCSVPWNTRPIARRPR